MGEVDWENPKSQIVLVLPLSPPSLRYDEASDGRIGGVCDESQKKLFNRKSTKALRKKLRNDMPAPEAIVWSLLRGKQMKGYRWRRQHGIGPYIVDFYCPSLQLVIEVDGDSHFEEGAEEYDKRRSKYITDRHIKILRFTNLDVTESIEGVYDVITENLP